MTVARILIFPLSIDRARLRLTFARLTWRRLQAEPATEWSYPALEAARQAYVEAWIHFQSISRL